MTTVQTSFSPEFVTGKPTLDRVTPTRRPQERVVMRQIWEKLLFLHWEVDPVLLQELLPVGLTVDTFEGRAYIGLVPFTMRGIRPLFAPAVPGLSNFHEVNVRTYVHHKGDAPGVWFFSLDAANRIAVEIARALWQLPYYHARMTLKERNGDVEYTSERIHPGVPSAGCRICYRPTGPPAPALPGTRDFFLLERYLLYAASKEGRLWRGQVHHSPYPVQGADVSVLNDTLLEASGVRLPGGESPSLKDALVHYAAGVKVEVFPLRPVPGI